MSPSRWSALLLAALMAMTIPFAAVAASSSNGGSASAAIAAVTRATNTFGNVPIKGTTAAGDKFKGTLDIVNFRVVNGLLTAVGSLSGTLTDSVGNVLGSVTDQRVQLPVSFGALASCDILHLRLGPINLNLLGLVVHTNTIVIDITGQAGPGNLVGNLLCAIAGILDHGLNLNGVLRDLLRALNTIL